MKKYFISLVCALVFGLTALADEGMWLLPYLEEMNYSDMERAGLKLQARDVYNPDGQSLKDAVVIFGKGCTGEIVSPDGLLFTNHHCGYGNIQQLSSTENDYLKNGFWAMSRREEIPVPGLSVQFVRHIEDVTEELTKGISIKKTYQQSQDIINSRIDRMKDKYERNNRGKKIIIESFYGGNQYFLFIMEEYTDVRFVGAPPSSIGKFGGDTDNWMWPRHTGDFSIFRVYASPDGVTPADYSADNVPYQAPVHLTVSAQGYEQDDFAMIMGFPGRTTRYMTTYEIDELLEVTNPIIIRIRGERQQILKQDMAASDAVRIKYADKYATSSNYWKNSIGKSKAVRELGVREQRQALEDRFTVWTGSSRQRAEYAQALPLIAEAKQATVPVEADRLIIAETILRSIDIANIAVKAHSKLYAMMRSDPDKVPEYIDELYKDYNEATDRKVAERMIELLIEMVSPQNAPAFVYDINNSFGGSVQDYVDWLYDTSIYANRERLENYLQMYGAENPLGNNDLALKLYTTSSRVYFDLSDSIKGENMMFREGHKLLIAGLHEMEPEVNRYPDANFTIRLTYGNIKPYRPADAVYYDYYSTLTGVMEKEDPANPMEFTVPGRLKELYQATDYGRYAGLADNGEPQLNTCFITTNDITGGNSGSPVLNAQGQLIGLAFDGNWDAMSGDVLFEHNMQRCINVDIRYMLFVIDKFAGAGYLLDEMTIVW